MGLFWDDETGCSLHVPGYPLLPKPGELYGQVFIMVNLLPILALNIGTPAIHFVDMQNVGAVVVNCPVSVYVEVP